MPPRSLFTSRLALYLASTMIELDEVVKTYRESFPLAGRRVRALDGVSLRVAPGTALGIVGINGAGKSTLLRILLGYLRPTSGEARIDGSAPRAYVEARGAAYVPEHASVPPGWTVRGALRAYAMLGDLGHDAWERVDAAIERLGLAELAGRRVRALSKGNLQRLAIAQALLGDRKLMVLDEPTDGLDPVWIAELRDIVREWLARDPARILILASHNLAEVERIADRVLLLHAGRIEGELGTGDGGASLEDRFVARVRRLQEPLP
ncbi:MAG: ABC transporter ATP-binding protein [Gemmatimonadota bacterium]